MVVVDGESKFERCMWNMLCQPLLLFWFGGRSVCLSMDEWNSKQLKEAKWQTQVISSFLFPFFFINHLQCSLYTNFVHSNCIYLCIHKSLIMHLQKLSRQFYENNSTEKERKKMNEVPI